MAKQLDLLATGKIIPTALHSEMEQSYLEYAMSVIVGRALPDVRDGLKPVHRRILYAMHELGLTPDRPYRKCARVVGDVLGKYHPHGDQSVYDALVRMVQDFSSRYPLLAGHGNFGSVDNDPPAAMRYTETRLAAIAQDGLLTDISEATVNYANNFDNSQQEPVVLPAQLPILLLNGCTGIAVGMATNVPPHNLGEIVDGLIALIDHPDLPDRKLWQLIPGPDFPTGGEIIGTVGIEEAYQTGRGSIPLRGVAHVEALEKGSKRRRHQQVLVITELPYQVNKAAWIEKVAELVNQERLKGIADIRDESDRDGMRVVIEIKRDGNPQEILRQLYRQTPLQGNFGAIFLTLVNNKPCQLSLREILTAFLEFRETTLVRRYQDELANAMGRRETVAALLAALANLDQVVDILRHAPDGTTARGTLITALGINEAQANAILAMPMRRLTGLERQKLEQEGMELGAQIERLEQLLGDRHELLKALKKELRSLKRKFGDPRRTKILTGSEPPPAAKVDKPTQAKPQGESIPPIITDRLPADAVVMVTQKGAIAWESPPKAPKLPRKLEDVLVLREPVQTREQVMVMTASGKVYPVAMDAIPSSGNPTPVIQLLSTTVQQKREPLSHFFLPPLAGDHTDLLVVTEQGRVKRVAAADLAEITNRGAVLAKLKPGDRPQQVQWVKPGQEVAIATSGGRILRCPINDEQIPIMGRAAQGSQGTRVRKGETIVGSVAIHPAQVKEFFLLTEQGYGKRLPLKELRLGQRGDIGTQALRFKGSDGYAKADRLLAIAPLLPGLTKIAVLTSTDRLLWITVADLPQQGKEGLGDRLPGLNREETLAGFIPTIIY